MGSGATGSPQVLPKGLAKLPPNPVGEPRSAENEDTAARRFNPCEDSVFVARISSSCTDVDEAA
ncbi:hypothetical protein DP73_03560 [Desulfosporosinus sp. HMP52]|nr:hypothetical protein DP73_03560 [Desulfosporosinus sp. HMP52]